MRSVAIKHCRIFLSPACLSIAAAVFAFFQCPYPAGAQALLNDTEKKPAASGEITRVPGLSYISGTYQINGWQNTLVQGDKNLSHWTWMPITGNIHSVPTMTGAQATEAAPQPIVREHYIKPIHIPTFVAPRPSENITYHYAEHPSHSSGNVSGVLHHSSPPSTNVSGLLRHPKVATAAYASYKQMTTSGCEGNIASSELHGTLLHK